MAQIYKPAVVGQALLLLVAVFVATDAVESGCCGSLQVFPVHEVGFGASDDIFIAASALIGASSVSLDGERCGFGSATMVVCPIRAYAHGRNVGALMASNATQTMVLTVNNTVHCPLNSTADGSLRRSASKTPVLTSVHAVWPIGKGLQRPIVFMTWQPSEQQRAVVSSGTWVASSVAESSTMSTMRLPHNGSAVFPVYTLVGAARVNISLYETTTGSAPESGRRCSAIVHPSIRYFVFPPVALRGITQDGMLTWMPIVDAVECHTSVVYLSPPSAGGAAARVLVRIHGRFPLSGQLPVVHLVDTHTHQSSLCTVLGATQSVIECLHAMPIETTTASTSLGLGSGYATSGDSWGALWRPAPPVMQRPPMLGDVGNTDAWNLAGNKTRGLLRMPSGNGSFRLHCASTQSMMVVDVTTNVSLCSVNATHRAASNVSDALQLRDGDALLLEVSCCTSIDGDCVAQEHLCAVSLEHMQSPSIHVAEGQTPIVVVFEITSPPTWTMPDVLSSLSGLQSEDPDFILNLTTDLALRVPYVSNADVCALTNVEHLVIAAPLSDPAEVQQRFASPGFNGSWRPLATRCTWHLVVPVASCRDVVHPLPIDLGHLVYCGLRSLFFDPIPLSMVEVPLEADAFERSDATGNASGRYWPHVAYAGHATATIAQGDGPAAQPVLLMSHRTTALAAPAVAVSTMVASGGSSIYVSVLLPDGDSSRNATMWAMVCNRSSVAFVAPSDASWSGLQRVLFANCTANRTNNATSDAWMVHMSIVVPLDVPAGYYRLVFFLFGFQAIAAPASEVPLTAATGPASFLWVAATVTSSSTEPIGANGGGTVTLRGTNFPRGTAMRFSILDGNGTSEVASELLVSGLQFAAWVVGDSSNVTGPRTLNTIQASWRLSVVVGNFTPQSIFGTIGILQPVALPKITSVAPLLLSAAQPAVFTVVGSGLSLKSLSVCAERGTPSSVTPFHERVLQSCEVCVPTFSNSTYAVCVLSTQLRIGLYAMYVSSPAVGTSFEAHIRCSLGIHGVTPLEASPHGLATLTIVGESFVDGWMVCLERSASHPRIPCHATSSLPHTPLANASTIVCVLPAVPDPTLLEGTAYVVVLQHAMYGYSLYCPQPELCTVSFTSERLPVLTSVTPRHGQSPMVVTVFGLLFTGNATWVDEDAENLALYVGTAPCEVERPVYFDRILCRLSVPCDSTNHPQVRAIVYPFGGTASSFDAYLRFTCELEVLDVTPLVGSAMGGQQVTIAGNGFPMDPIVRVAGELCDVSLVSQTSIVCTTRGLGAVMDLSGAVTVVAADDENVRGSCCTYTYSAAITPIVNSIAPTTGSEGVRATVIGLRFTAGVQVEMSGILITDAVVLSSTSINLLIPRLPPAVARLKLSISGIGYAFHAATLENFTYSLTISRITPSRGSYQSGLLLTIVGSGLGINSSSNTVGSVVTHQPLTRVFICGRLCPLVSVDFNLLVCSVPAYMDVFMLQQYPASAAQGALTADDMVVYRRMLGQDGTTVGWVDATASFVRAGLAGEQPPPPMIAQSGTEFFIIAAHKHARLSLTSLRLSLSGVHNMTQNVSCVLRRNGAAISTLSVLDPSIADWCNRSLWSSTVAWVAMSMLDGETANDLTVRYDTARFFSLTCERLIEGETQIASGQVEGVVVGVNAVGGMCPVNIAVTSTSEVFESCKDPLGAACSTFVYDSTLTPILAASSVAYALFTAPTRLTLTGSGFGVSVDAVASVVVGELACQVQLAQESSLVCVTQGRLRSPIVMSQGVSIVGKGLAKVVSTEPFRGVEPWSSPASWYASMPPTTPGDIVHIPPGTFVLLDCPPPRLTAIVVEGTLVIADIAMNIELGLLLIAQGGVVQGGNAVTPLASLINLTFVSTPYLASDVVGANDHLVYRRSNTSLVPWPHMAIIVDGGALHLSGAAEAIVSSFLQQTAIAGARSVIIQDRVGWAVGTTILITGTTPVVEEMEERVIVAKTLVGNTAILELDQPLEFTHLRSTETFLRNAMELSARVVLLTRNIVIQGESASEGTREGVSVYLLNQAHVVLRSIALYRCGKATTTLHGAAAIELSNVQYPDALAVAQRIVVRQSYHRGIALRNTRLVSLLTNVIYRTDGHGIATLGGRCWNTSLSANIVCRSQHAVVSGGDHVPANYYLTNPSVSMSTNVGSGSHGHGVWFDLYNDQSSHPNPKCLTHRPILLFAGNILNGAAHDGIRITPSLLARAQPCVDRALGVQPSNPFVATSIMQTLVFGCGGHGIFVGPVGALSVLSCVVIDVGLAAFSCGASAGSVTVGDTLLSGLLADGTTLLPPWMPPITARSGIVLRGGAVGFTISNVLIRNATKEAFTNCPTVAAEAATVPVFVASSKLTITGSNLSFHARFCGSVALFDTDGSLTQLQREAYLIAGSLDTLRPSSFSMCRTFNDTDLAYSVSSMIVERHTGSNKSLLMCETQSTYLFFAVSVTVQGCPWCSRVAVDVFHDGALLTSFNLSTTTTTTSPDDAPAQLGHDRTATFLAVDGRPSTVTALSKIFSSRLQYLMTPQCDGASDPLMCHPSAVLLSRVGALRPNFPSQFLVDAKNNAMYMLQADAVLPQWTLPHATLAFHQRWLRGAPLTTVRYESSTEAPQCALVHRNSTQVAQRAGMPEWVVSVWFSTTQISEGVLVTPVGCPAAAWCVPPIYPTTAAAASAAPTTWTNASAWFDKAVPNGRRATVAVIPQGVSMRLNINATGLQALIVVGSLLVDADAQGGSLVLECTQLVVLGSMTVVASTGQYTATIRVRTQQDLQNSNDTHMLCANNATTSVVLSPTLSIECGTVLVSGSLSASGAVRSTWWPLRNSIASGTYSFEAEPLMALQSGWEVGATSSDARYPVGDWNRLASTIAPGDDATNATQFPWQSHHASTRLTRSLTRTVEAVNFEKSVRIDCGRRPTPTMSFVPHCRIVVYRPPIPSSLALLSPNTISLYHVRVARFGYCTAKWSTTTTEDDGLAIHVPTAMVPGAPAIHIAETAWSARFNHTLIVNATHVGLYVAPGSTQGPVIADVINSVVWNSVGSGVVLSGARSSLRSTLIAGTTFPRDASTGHLVSSVTPLCGVLELDGGNTINTTTVAGSESEGFCLPWTACQLPMYAALTARACAVGVFLYDPSENEDAPTTPCAPDQTMGGGIEVYRNSFIGIVSTQHTSLTLSGVVSAANPVGVYAGSRLGATGTTRIASSTFGGGALITPTSASACAPPPCSPSFAVFGALASCYTSLFAFGFEAAGILLVPHSMASVPLWYSRSTASPPITARVAPSAFNATISIDATIISGVSFVGFGQCGTAVAYNPMATSAGYPQVTTTSIRLDDTPRRVYAPATTPAASPSDTGERADVVLPAGLCADQQPCNPSQGLVISDTDGSIRGQNATSIIVRHQTATDLMLCSLITGVLATCPTTVSLGRLVVESVDDFQGMMVRCFQVTAYSSVRPTFGACAATSRGNGVVDPVVSVILLTGVELHMVSEHVPRNLRVSLQQCGTTPVLLTLQLVETDMRLTVWVDSVERTMGQAKPKLTDRHGEWYRNPLLVGDDVSGDDADWLTVAVQCGQRVGIHHIVRGTFRMVLNTSVSLITYGHRAAVAATIAAVSGRPTETVFVASVTPSTPRTQCVVTVLLEGLDSSTYNATHEALMINAALQVLAKMDMVNLSSHIGLLAFSSAATPVALTLRTEPPADSLFTLTNVLGLTGALAGVACIGMLFYWYLLGLRYSVNQHAKRQYNGVVFGPEVDVLPATDANNAFLIEDTVAETSAVARQQAYLEEWKIPFSRSIFTDTNFFGSSVKSSSADSSESERPLPPPSATFLDLDPHTHLPVGSVITAFLQTNQNDRRMRSPRQPSMEMKTPLTHGESCMSGHGAPLPFQLEPTATPPSASVNCGSIPPPAVHTGSATFPGVDTPAGHGLNVDVDTPVGDGLNGSGCGEQTPCGEDPSHNMDSFLRKSPRRVSFAFSRSTDKGPTPQHPGHPDSTTRRCSTPRAATSGPPLPPLPASPAPGAAVQPAPSCHEAPAISPRDTVHPPDTADGPSATVRKVKRSRFTSSKW